MTTYLFNAFSEETKNTLGCCTLDKGETLFRQGELATRLYLVKTGCVRLVVCPSPNKELVLYRAKDEEAFAEEHLVHETYTYSAIADQKTELVYVEKEVVLSEFSSSLSTARSFMSCVCGRYYQLRVNFERVGISPASERVLHLLKTLAKESSELDLSGKIKSYAQDLNLTHEAVYRALRDLENQQIIQRVDGKLRLIKQD